MRIDGRLWRGWHLEEGCVVLTDNRDIVGRKLVGCPLIARFGCASESSHGTF